MVCIVPFSEPKRSKQTNQEPIQRSLRRIQDPKNNLSDELVSVPSVGTAATSETEDDETSPFDADTPPRRVLSRAQMFRMPDMIPGSWCESAERNSVRFVRMKLYEEQ